MRTFIKALVLTSLLFAGVLPVAAQQQNPVTTSPQMGAAFGVSGTVLVTNSFQQIFAGQNPTAGQRRLGCTVQNTGSSTLYVYFGLLTAATTVASFQVAPSQAIYCQAGVGVIQDAVSVSGTAGNSYVGALQ